MKYAITTPVDLSYVWTATLVDTKPFVYGSTCKDNKDNGKTYTAKNGGKYVIECATDHYGGDFGALDTETFDACMDACDAKTGCIDVSFTAGRCYLKDRLEPARSNSNVWTGRKTS